MAETFFISDTHFNHDNIIKYTNRPFDSITEMNEFMIDVWNAKVRPNDRVIHLGDFGFSAGVTPLPEVLYRLNGRKTIVRGNHDPTHKKLLEWGFDESVNEMSLGRYVLNHKPLFNIAVDDMERLYPEAPIERNADGNQHAWVLCGHEHNNKPVLITDTFRRFAPGDMYKNRWVEMTNVNMSVEWWNYEPSTLEEIEARIAMESLNNNL